MAKLKTVISKSVPFTTGGGETIRLDVRVLNQIERVRAIQYTADGDIARALQVMLAGGVTGWSDVLDEHDQPIPFNANNLNNALGCDHTLGDAVMSHLFKVNGINAENEVPPLEPTSEPSSESNSNAAGSASRPESRSSG